jgi:hypothetical protein
MRLATVAAFTIITAVSAAAQAVWSSSAVTAVPQFRGDGTQRLQTVDPAAPGKGIRLADNYIGQSYAYIPVVAPQGSAFRFLHLRAHDSSLDGAVRAEFFRQPRVGPAGPAVTLAAVMTGNAAAVQTVLSPAFGPEFINMARFSYYIRLTLKRSALAATPIAYDVSLTQ